MAGLVIMMLTFMVLTCCFYGDENTDGDKSGNGGAGVAGIDEYPNKSKSSPTRSLQ